MERHEFYEIVRNYYRARHHLASAEHDINILKKDAAKYSDMVWQIKEETIELSVSIHNSEN